MATSDLSDLRDLDYKISRAERSSDKRSMIFAFTGRGAQQAQMGQKLLTYPVFRESLCDSQTILEHRWAQLVANRYLALCVREEYPQTDSYRIPAEGESDLVINRPEVSPPLCTPSQLALVDLLRSFNIIPRAVLGHSSGEIAAA